MTAGGDHGGSTDMEMKTVLFVYQKQEFPLAKLYQKEQGLFEYFDKTIRITDLTSITSLLLDIPFPFVNVGVFHPILT